MRIPSQNCPPPLQFHQDDDLRLCGKSDGRSCDSVNIPTYAQSYSKVLGKVRAYQYASTDAFFGHPQNIETYYVDGISITYGSSPRTHVWTYAVGQHQFVLPLRTSLLACCPSNGYGAGPWDFVGDNYFCSSGNPNNYWSHKLYNTTLWSNIQGNCSFCGKEDLSFCVELETSTTEDLELRVCTDQPLFDEDIRIESIEFYIG